MESLSAIVQSLSPGEKNLVRHFYRLKDIGENKKRAKLFEMLCGKNVPVEAQVAKQLGYVTVNSSFTNMKMRLRSDVLNILFLQESSSKFSTPYAQAVFNCRRSLMQGEILLSRGVYEEALEMLAKAGKLAARFELFAEQIQIADLMRNHIAVRDGSEAFRNISENIELNFSRLNDTLRSKRSHYELSMPRLLGVRSYDEYCTKGKVIAEEVAAIDERSGSSRVKLYCGLASLNYYSSVHDFPRAEKHATVLLDAVENDPVVMSKSNQAGISMELANIYLNTAQYDKAIEHASRAVSLFKPGMINQLHAYMVLVFAHFRNNDKSAATDLLDTAMKHRLVQRHQHPVMSARLNLLKAGLSFSEGDYDRSAAILRENTELVRDKEGWMPGYFLLESLILIEKQSVELAGYRVEAFRKSLYRNGISKDERRIHAITNLLKQLLRVNCDYEKVVNRKNDEIRMLSEAKAHYYWNPAGYEIIRFDEWLMKKVS